MAWMRAPMTESDMRKIGAIRVALMLTSLVIAVSIACAADFTQMVWPGEAWAFDQSASSISKFGVVGDGLTDDTAAFMEALRATSGAALRIDKGVRVRTTRPIIVASGVHLLGEGEVLFDHGGYGLTVKNGEFRAKGLRFNGQNRASGGVKIDNAPLVEIEDCEFVGFSNDDHVQAVTVVDAVRLVVRRTQFSKLFALSDGTQGNTAGSVRAIYVSGRVMEGLIAESQFIDINNRTATGQLSWEDADAIQAMPHLGRVQHITFFGNNFVGIGKRAIKFGGAESSYAILDNTVVSRWRDTIDEKGIYGNGMYFVFESFGGRALVVGNRVTGGVASGFLAISGTSLTEARIVDNVFDPQPHLFANNALTKGIEVSGVSAAARVAIYGNRFANVAIGVTGIAFDEASNEIISLGRSVPNGKGR